MDMDNVQRRGHRSPPQDLRDAEQIRAALGDALGYGVPERLWTFLVDENYIAEVVSGERSLENVLEKVRTYFPAFAPSAVGEQPGPGGPRRMRQPRPATATPAVRRSPSQDAVLALLVAAEAARDPDVREFRSGLPSGPLRPEAAAEWITAQDYEDAAEQQPSGGGTFWLLQPIPIPQEWVSRYLAGSTEPLTLTLTREEVVRSMGWKFLRFSGPGEQSEHVIPTIASRRLDRLRIISERLARRYGWRQGEATLFVLAGVPPAVRPVAVRVAGDDPNHPSLPHITLSARPTVAPRVVEDQYRQARRRFISGRQRELSHKQLQLVEFVLTQPSGETWARRMAVWNAAHRDAPHTVVSNMARDYARARRYLLRIANIGTDAQQDSQEESNGEAKQ